MIFINKMKRTINKTVVCVLYHLRQICNVYLCITTCRYVVNIMYKQTDVAEGKKPTIIDPSSIAIGGGPTVWS